MQNNDWYADTAYDSRKKKDVPPPNPAAWKGKERALRAHPLPIGVHLGDFRSDLEKATIKELKNDCLKERINHEYGELYTAANPQVVFGTLRWLGGFLSVLGLIGTYLMFDAEPEIDKHNFWNYAFFIVPFSIFILSAILVKILPDKNNTIFNRRTGLVTIPRPWKSPIVLPFAEFDAYYYCSQTTVNVNYHLYLGHRFTPFGFPSGRNWTRRYWVHGEWEFFQQYMDISMPLPDLPSLEPYRHLDPTTAAYDKQHNRPPHYWRDIEMDQLEKERQAGIEAIEKYPWEQLPTDHIPDELMKKLFPGVRLLS